MSTTSTTHARCPECGTEQEVLVVESANVQRFPEFRTRLLDRTLMRFTCTRCARPFVIEHEMLYTDLERRQFFGVFPRGAAAQFAQYEEWIEATYRQAFLEEGPNVVRQALNHCVRRVVFGYEQLREKVVCFDAGLDDRILEAVKVALGDTEPALGARLSLQSVAGGRLLLATESGAAVAVDRDVYDGIAADADRIKTLLAPLWQGLFVSAERCTV
ncbi:MAG TPA: CpXC domain-containing protein [Vicinamibacterales bacterium]|nr:CpXC domain-containing protein [Vicinamibacterales bacterium]